MAKYGRGFAREIVAAINAGEIREPFGREEVREFVRRRGWQTPDTYMNVVLDNSSNEDHSLGYPKYFEKVSRGRFKLKPEYKGHNWR